MRRELKPTMVVFLLAAALFTSTTALAHQVGNASGFSSGFTHPLSGWDHILAMVAVGLWGAQLGPPAIFLLPITFPLMMAFGGFIGLVGAPLPAVEIGIGASALVLGLVVAIEARPALWIAMALVAAFAVFHGYAHGAELEPGADALAYSLGFVIATGLLHATGIAIGLIRKWRPGEKLVQGLGGAVALAGVAFPGPGVVGMRDAASSFIGPMNVHCVGQSRTAEVARTVAATIVLLLAAESEAHAHLVTTGLGPLYDGVMHVFLSPEDAVSVLALALLAGMSTTLISRIVLYTLPVTWLIGGALGWREPAAPPFPLLTIATFIGLGSLIALNIRLAAGPAAGAAIALGLTHGFVDGSGLARISAPVTVLAGIGIAIFVVTSIVAAVVTSLPAPWMRIAVRTIGSWIAAGGLLLLGWNLRGVA